MKEVKIYRGCPGSGKTTARKKYFPEAFVCSAVNLHTDQDGNYKFYQKGNPDAQKYCRNAFLAAIQNGLPLIAVDNPNIKLGDFDWYIKKAKEYGYEVQVFRMKVADPVVAARRNIHRVFKEKVVGMHYAMEDFEGETFI